MIEKLRVDHKTLSEQQTRIQAQISDETNKLSLEEERLTQQAQNSGGLSINNGDGAQLPPNEYGNNADMLCPTDPNYQIYGHPVTNQLQAVVQNQQALLI